VRTTLLALTIALLAACAVHDGPTVTDAVEDFIAVAELEDQSSIRTSDQYTYSVLSDQYIVLKTRKEYYLVQFARRCRELEDRPVAVTPDIRYDHNKLRARFDTIRGCRIDRIFRIEKVQAEELESLGKAPG